MNDAKTNVPGTFQAFDIGTRSRERRDVGSIGRWRPRAGGAENGYIDVTVWGSGVSEGGDGYEIPPETIRKLPPCFYSRWKTGAEVYEQFINNPIGPDNYPQEHDHDRFENWEDYENDDEGYWWTGNCSSARFESDVIGEFADYVDEWFEENPPMYVEPGDPEPVPDVPPEVLVEYAHEAMELPEPEVSWNPKRDGDGATLVNIDTWFWLDDGPVELEVHAEAGGNTATVQATLGEISFSAPSAASVSSGRKVRRRTVR
ncbi:hypothetical protein EF847_00805 [Actinobacteria bacterium YIM 96077]|uniref:Uncharacterized protein n=2 Tax=Phytoactinopolyspora halophila TaxID=1981511 RepID=A0A329R249_9ACTN|nr:hypothetical protein EF847_00805 [Actinobacteria bacterium YIM 96077]RAW18039.1 hypothetical protein DPM12_04200 [Phytoactinopolyspora halophila]